MLLGVFLLIPVLCYLLVSLPYFHGSRYVRTRHRGDDVLPGKELGQPHPHHSHTALGREGQHSVVLLTSFQRTRRFWPALAEGRNLPNTVLFHVQSKGVAKHNFLTVNQQYHVRDIPILVLLGDCTAPISWQPEFGY